MDYYAITQRYVNGIEMTVQLQTQAIFHYVPRVRTYKSIHLAVCVQGGGRGVNQLTSTQVYYTIYQSTLTGRQISVQTTYVVYRAGTSTSTSTSIHQSGILYMQLSTNVQLMIVLQTSPGGISIDIDIDIDDGCQPKLIVNV